MIALRPAAGGDVRLLIELSEEAFDPRFGEGWNGAQLMTALEARDSFAQVAAKGGLALGFSLTRQILDEAELLLVAVHPQARRTGIGRTLVDDVVDRARSRGACSVFLEVRDGNAAAIALYRRAGFTEVGRRRGYYLGANHARFDAITMRREV